MSLDPSLIDSVLDRMSKPASLVDHIRKQVPTDNKMRREDEDPEDEDYVPFGMDGVLASTEKLLAVNRGLDKPDRRDALEFKSIMTPDRLLAERVKMDTDRARAMVLPMLAKQRSFKNLTPYAFDNYARGFLVGNPLSSPLEEINPMHIVEQHRRITQMGPGGIGSDDAISPEMQMVQADQFGFLDILSGPECFPGDHEVYTWNDGWKRWDTVQDDDELACRVDGRLEFHKPTRVVREHYVGPLMSGETSRLRMVVTPNHNVLVTNSSSGYKEKLKPAHSVYGRHLTMPSRHKPMKGEEYKTSWALPKIEKTNNNQAEFEPFDIGDWSEFLGWWMAEGCLYEGQRLYHGKYLASVGSVSIKQCPVAHPEDNERIRTLMKRMGLLGDVATSSSCSSSAKQVVSYFRTWNMGCYDKWLPDEVFKFPIHARERLLEALIAGDGRNIPGRRKCYCTVSPRLARSVEKLAITLGYPAFIREEPDRRSHVKTTNYVVSLSHARTRQIATHHWTTIHHDGMVYCATVPGGLLLVRGKDKTPGYWSGNSSRAGVDTRAAWGTRLGSDGKLYQVMYDRKRKKYRWMSPQDISGKVVKLPD